MSKDDKKELEEISEIDEPRTTPLTEFAVQEGDQVFKFLNSLYGGLQTIAELTDEERAYLLRLDMMIKLHKDLKLEYDYIQEFRNNFLKYTISKKRKGRTEVLEAIAGQQSSEKRRYGSIFRRR